jgi:transcriptional regulator with XRE-family HTH domain
MATKNTIAALRIRQEMKEKSLSGSDLAALSNLSYYTVENILSGKSSKVDKLEAIAKALGKPLMYFIKADFSKDNNAPYDGELHYKVVKMISDICKRDKIYLTKEKMDKLINFVYPRLKKDDPDSLMTSQTEAIVDYAIKNDGVI